MQVPTLGLTRTEFNERVRQFEQDHPLGQDLNRHCKTCGSSLDKKLMTVNLSTPESGVLRTVFRDLPFCSTCEKPPVAPQTDVIIKEEELREIH